MDPALLRTQWWDPLLTLSVLVVPAALALTWLGQLTVRYGSGPAHPETVAEKLATTLAFGFALVILLGFRARHRRRQRAALQEIRAYEEAEAARRRADDS